jgi:hypothetical protein
MGKISLSVVLAEIDQTVQDGEPHYFSISYAKVDGSLGHIEKAEKGRKDRREIEEGDEGTGKAWNHNLKFSGNLLLYNHDKKGYREIKIYLLRKYNGHKIYFG